MALASIFKRLSVGPALHGGVLFLFSILTASFSLNVLSSLGHRTFPSTTSDNYANFWNLFWMKKSMVEWSDPFFTHDLYYPTGTSLAFTEFGPLYGILSTPWQLLFSSPSTLVISHNLLVLSTFVLTGYCTFLFCRWYSGSISGAFFAAAALTFSAFRFHHLEHINLLSWYWIPLTMWLIGTQILRSAPSSETNLLQQIRRPLVLVAICSLGAAATSYTILALGFIYLVVWMPLELMLRSNVDRRVSRFTLTLCSYLLGTLPITWRWIQAFLQKSLPIQDLQATKDWGPDLAGFFMPSRSAILGNLTNNLDVPVHGPGGLEIYLGLSFLLCGGIGVLALKRRARPLALLAFISWVVSMGPSLWVAGKLFELPISPYELMTRLVPALGVGRTPERFIILTFLALAPIAAVGFGSLRRKTRWQLFQIALLVLLVIELSPRLSPPDTVTMPQIYTDMRRDPTAGAVVELSPQFNLARFMFHQTTHQRPIVGNVLTRPSKGSVDLVRELNIYGRLARPDHIEDVMKDLEQVGVRYLVIHRGDMSSANWHQAVIAFSLHADKTHEDDTLALFRLPGS